MPYEYPGPNPYQSSGDKSAAALNAWFQDVAQSVVDLQDLLSAMFGAQAVAVVACGDYGLQAGKVQPESPEAMQVEILPVRAIVDKVPFHIPDAQHPTFTAPTLDPRIDVIAASASQRLFVVRTGAEAPTPVAPLVADDEVELARIHLVPGMTAIYAAATSGEGHIEDRRVWLNV